MLLLALIGLGILALLVLAVSRKKSAAIRARVPQVEVLDQEQEIVLVVELPGVDQEEIQVEVVDDAVFVETRGERRYATAEILPEPVDATSLRTGYENGLLTIRIAREGYDLQHQPAGPELAVGA